MLGETTMFRKVIVIFAMLGSGFLIYSYSHAKQPRPKLWAAISVCDPLFQEGWTKDLTIHFTLVNDGNAVADPRIESWKIIVNGEEIENSGFIFGNGIRTSNWNALAPGDALRFTYGLEQYFNKPGIYRVSWKGKDFEASTIVFRVMPSKNNR
jgi:hypothetical protein